jgi:hypothetical protein
VAAIDPKPFRHHPLPQRLDADPQTVTCNQFFRRERGSEVDVMFAHQAQNRGPEALATLAVARPTAFARRQTGRAIRRIPDGGGKFDADPAPSMWQRHQP